jgi:predicted esterase
MLLIRSIFFAAALSMAIGSFAAATTGAAQSATTTASAAAPTPAPTIAPETGRAFDIPRLDHITIDGDADDWGDRGFRVDLLAGLNGTSRDPAQFYPQFRLGWDARGLLVLASVHDAFPSEEDNPELLNQGDCLELFMASRVGSPDAVQLWISPGVDPAHPEPRTKIINPRSIPGLKHPPMKPVISRKKIEGGYVLEALLPWESFGITPKIGEQVAVQVQVDDAGTAGFYTAAWFPASAGGNSSHLQTLRLADSASPPVRAAASAGYAWLRRVGVNVVGMREFAGEQVELRQASAPADSPALCSATLVGSNISMATLTLPIPPIGSTSPPLAVWVGHHLLATLDLPDLNALRRYALKDERLTIRNRVLNGKIFSTPEFARPSEVEDEIGPFTLSTAYYDAHFNPVDVASTPGRYGAITEVKDASGQVMDRRYTTLFRAAAKVDWRGVELHTSMSLPDELGLAPDAGRDQPWATDDLIRGMLRRSLIDEPDVGTFFAGLSEQQPNEIGERYISLRRRDDRWWHDLKQTLGLLTPYHFLLHLPPNYQSQPRWPLILFLHGAGERGDDLTLVQHEGLCEYLQTHPEFPFIVISPQCPAHNSWSASMLTDLLDEAMAKYAVDPDRVYVTGLSMGGFGTWDLAAATPQRFAAAVPIAGGDDPGDAVRLRRLPLQVFHSSDDPIVPIREDQRIISALQAVGAEVTFTVYPSFSHDSWTRTYDNPDLWAWLLQQRRQPATVK